jgi:hypothetical protein
MATPKIGQGFRSVGSRKKKSGPDRAYLPSIYGKEGHIMLSKLAYIIFYVLIHELYLIHVVFISLFFFKKISSKYNKKNQHALIM